MLVTDVINDVAARMVTDGYQFVSVPEGYSPHERLPLTALAIGDKGQERCNDDTDLPPFRCLRKHDFTPESTMENLFGLKTKFAIPQLMMDGRRAVLFLGELGNENAFEAWANTVISQPYLIHR